MTRTRIVNGQKKPEIKTGQFFIHKLKVKSRRSVGKKHN